MSNQASDETQLDALVFDVGGVIATVDNDALFVRLASRCTPGTRPADVARLLAQARWDEGTPIAALHAQLAADLGYAADWATFHDDWCHHLGFDAPMVDLVAALAARHRVILFSNTNAEHWEHLLALPGSRLENFEQVVSYKLGRAKPAVDAFHRMAEATGIAPERALFFDDRSENVAGARAAGFQAEVFTDEAGLRRALDAVGIAVAEPAH